MKTKKKILYVEDMQHCYERTKEAVGKGFEIDWKRNYKEGLNAIINNFEEYSAGVFDVNLDYKPDIDMKMQSTEGLELIALAKKEREKRNISFPILCASQNNAYRELALNSGADIFTWKKAFWENGNKILKDLIKKI